MSTIAAVAMYLMQKEQNIRENWIHSGHRILKSEKEFFFGTTEVQTNINVRLQLFEKYSLSIVLFSLFLAQCVIWYCIKQMFHLHTFFSS